MSSLHQAECTNPDLPATNLVTREPFWSRHRVTLILLGILAIAAFFRFYGSNYDQDHNQHPDERFIVGVSLDVRLPDSVSQALDWRISPLNLRRVAIGGCNDPRGCSNFSYGSFPVYMARAAAWVADRVWPGADTRPPDFYSRSYEGMTAVGRHLAALFDLLTILFVFLIARRLYSRSTALIAAALVAFAVTEIQIAHFYASDTFLVTFMMSALYFSVVLMQRPVWWAAIGAGTFLGLAVASKVSIAPFALVIVAAIALRAAYRKRTRALGAKFGDPIGVKPAPASERSLSFWGHFLRGLRYLVTAGIFALLAFAITEPYVLWSFDFSAFTVGGWQAFLDSNPWWRAISEQAGIQSGQADVPYTRQYVGTVPLLYHLQQLVLWGLSPIPGIVAVVGFVIGIWRAVRRHPAEILLMSGAIPYFATILTLEAKWMRYMLPLVPIFCILGAAFLVRGVILGRSRFQATAPALPFDRLRLAWQRNVFPALVVMTIGAAFLWSVAFMNIYSQPHSRVQASTWIYDNIPDGAKHSIEAWDDELPLGLPAEKATPGHPAKPPRGNGEHYPGPVQFDLYGDHPADEELNYIKGQMAQTDYIILASNRIYGSVSRLPWRYPVQTKFYELLFAGKLGFQPAHTEMVTPELLGIKFNDQSADESFTVYDHPRVDIFKKVSTLTDDQLHTLFSPALNRPAGEYTTQRHGSVSDDKSLQYNVPVSALPDTADYSWNPLAQEDTQWIGVALWLLAVYLLAFAALPIVFAVCRNLPDRGYPVAKLIGLMIVSWGSWLLSSLHILPFTVWTVLLVLLLMAALSYLCWRLGAGQGIRHFMSSRRSLVFFYEGLFLAAFAAFLIIRLINPDLWQTSYGGEKPMEFGFLNATLRSAWMPPLDPFFSGGYINYYYQGLFIVATLIKLVGIDPAIAFNLAIPLLYGLAFTAAASVVYNIVAWSQRRRGSAHLVSRGGLAFGFLAAFLMLAIGNMHALYQWIVITFPGFGRSLEGWVSGLIRAMSNGDYVEQAYTTPLTSFDFWGPSRVVSHTINEFPYWSFLYADLHPHLIDLPFTLLAAILCLNIAFSGRFARNLTLPVAQGPHWWRGTRTSVVSALSWLWGGGWSGVLRFTLLALTLGTLAAANSWDYPTYLALMVGAVLVALLLANKPRREPSGVQTLAERGPRLSAGDKWSLYIVCLVSVGLLAGLALLAYAPFFLGFKAFFTKIMPLVDGGFVPGTTTIMHRTTLAEYLVVWALFVFVCLSYLVYRLWKFPWRAAVQDIVTPSSAPNRRGLIPNAGHAFSLPQRRPRLVPALASASPDADLPTTMALAVREEPAGSGEQLAEREPAPYPDNGQEDVSSGRDIDAQDVTTAEDYASSPSGTVTAETAPQARPAYPTNDGEGPDGLYEPLPSLYEPEPAHWVAEAHTQAGSEVVPRPRTEQPGVIPLWAGFWMLGVTAALTVLQLVTGQYLLALLIALIGGIAATTLPTSRSAANLFAGLLLLGALAVSLGVEIVYLADHLSGGESFRMNTVFKFYEQVWVLFAVGSGAAIYYILYGLRELPATPQDHETNALLQTEGPVRPLEVDAVPPSTAPSNGHSDEAAMHETALPAAPLEESSNNWLVWSAEASQSAFDLEPEEAPVQTFATDELPVETSAPASQPALPDTRAVTAINWTPRRIAWTTVLALFIAAGFLYTYLGTPVRLAQRFPVNPPVGTLNGLKYMTTGTYQAQLPSGLGLQVNLKYDYDAINWMNKNIHDPHVIAEAPVEYYRADGMRAATNTGFPMVVGGLHQDEQRYGWLVGDRRGDMEQFFTTTDPQKALTYISKYDIDYIYLGQLEQKMAGAGMAKFAQLATPKVAVLKQVFKADSPEGVPGTIIYQVIRDVKPVVGAPVANSGIPGISITPVPTSTPLPPPTPPVDDPALKALIADVTANPTDRDKRMKLVEWYRDHSYFLDAARELETVVKQDPSDVAVRQQLGDAYQSGGKPDKALKAWEDARDVAPSNPAGHNKVGIAYRERKRYDDAIREFQTAVAADSTFTESWFNLGQTYEAKGDLDNAKKAYQSAIDKSKDKQNDSWVQEARKRLNQIR